MEMVKTTTAPGRAAEHNKPGPRTRKRPIPLLVAGTSAMAVVFLFSLLFPQNMRNIGSFGPGALVAAFVVGVAAIRYREIYAREKGRRGRDAGTRADAEESVQGGLESLPEGYLVC